LSYYIHAVPGRLRLKMPLLKGDTLLAAEVQTAAKQVAGVESATVNPLTGSLIINYTPEETDSRAIIDGLVSLGYLDVTKAVESTQKRKQEEEQARQAAARAIVSFVVDRALANTGLGFLSILI